MFQGNQGVFRGLSTSAGSASSATRASLPRRHHMANKIGDRHGGDQKRDNGAGVHHAAPSANPIWRTANVTIHAKAVIATICTIGHFQEFVSRRTTATVLMHCIAKT